ncbi:bifunctional 4-hydroxy-2-oxoglutarate aldolase/2-dehydro-3-deoxy-phosphogluconate aldolase [Calidifontibacillus erzurumensis]|uniref:Bifunctional 4-hydroxy-2-oxoglutarate aldolase/2-dehydro-3-deoxy-phosphogluconate aldolase n=1 Tax=Calidifontibacillus erzurumensis TaxID=2741433 RepID=A0A8J8GGT8_9BACI|nr:bifunctional 4-hydroxy-2-oxoglutarate aldolase/2-dehydro-3-deoxy-phosphogluconate aldolase [Calidifontibacillus erzurumensis]NSL53112.1 bifunctional 4-hydroxy-2-oxoglutarate aldolase/2-dehydro-3-deoxy-phosphogluconate aldolase [Calidifontibacillus erzurumensis]
MNVYDFVKENKIIAIIRGIDKKDIIPVAEALYDGGIKIVEVTMNTDDAPEMISMLNKKYGDMLYIGAGTVLDIEMASQALDAGAKYFITPNVDEDVISFSLNQNIGIIPGVMTPTEVVNAYKAGAKMVKVFPTSILGSNYIKELQGPLSHIPMIAVGGVRPENISDFINAGAVGVGVGNSLIDKVAIKEGNFRKITEKAKILLEKLKDVHK